MEPPHGASVRLFRTNQEGVKLATPRSSRDYTIELSGDTGAHDFSNWGVQYKVGVAPLGLADDPSMSALLESRYGARVPDYIINDEGLLEACGLNLQGHRDPDFAVKIGRKQIGDKNRDPEYRGYFFNNWGMDPKGAIPFDWLNGTGTKGSGNCSTQVINITAGTDYSWSTLNYLKIGMQIDIPTSGKILLLSNNPIDEPRLGTWACVTSIYKNTRRIVRHRIPTNGRPKRISLSRGTHIVRAEWSQRLDYEDACNIGSRNAAIAASLGDGQTFDTSDYIWGRAEESVSFGFLLKRG